MRISILLFCRTFWHQHGHIYQRPDLPPSPPGVQSHPGASATEGPRDPGEAEGTLRESPPFLNLEPVHCIVGWLEGLVP